MFFSPTSSLTFLTLVSAPLLVPHFNATNAFDGYWEAIHVTQQDTYNEADVLLTAYRCDIGNPFGEFSDRSWLCFKVECVLMIGCVCACV